MQTDLTLDATSEFVMGIITYPDLLDGAGPDEDLFKFGLTSGDLIKLAVAIEERTGVPLEPTDMPEIHTVSGIHRLLTRSRNAERGGNS